MKISFVERHLKVYGGVRTILEFANRLVKRGHDVTLFLPDGTPVRAIACSGIPNSLETIDFDGQTAKLEMSITPIRCEYK